MRNLWVWVLVVLLVMSLVGEIPWRKFASSQVTLTPDEAPGSHRTLFILVHGFEPDEKLLAGTAAALASKGDVIRVAYPARLMSNADPQALTDDLSERLEKAIPEGRYTDIRFVAHSSGALIARRTLLNGWRDHKSWAKHVTRMALLAGMNRGWNVNGLRPLDMSEWKRWYWRIGEWFGRLTRTGSFILDLKTGTEFVADLRLDWMNAMRDPAKSGQIEVVQLLGDIDDVVSLADNEDLRAMQSAKYALVRVRGTGHKSIIDLADPKMGAYRTTKLLLAAACPFDEVVAQNEEQPYTTDLSVTSIVFVLHGIRDLGEWSSQFETHIRAMGPSGVAIVSPRYGYLGMGPFLLPKVRERYVRWFMDEYTETLARYPNVTPDHIQFFGHSNGTYVLADALKDYRSLRINRIVFAGSVVPKKFDWQKLVEAGQVKHVRNYVATTDWVVALFPRLFEMRPAAWLKNDLGSAGFNGFDAGGGCNGSPATPAGAEPVVENVCYIAGEHSAFDSDARVAEIAAYLVAGGSQAPARVERTGIAAWLLALPAVVWLVWVALAGVVVYLGVRVTSSAPSPTWVALVLFLLLVLRTLQTV